MTQLIIYQAIKGPEPDSYRVTQLDAEKSVQRYESSTFAVLKVPFRDPLPLRPDQRRFTASGPRTLQVTFRHLPEGHIDVNLKDLTAFKAVTSPHDYQRHLLQAGQGVLLLDLDWL